jgi:hypothetical protein
MSTMIAKSISGVSESSPMKFYMALFPSRSGIPMIYRRLWVKKSIFQRRSTCRMKPSISFKNVWKKMHMSVIISVKRYKMIFWQPKWKHAIDILCLDRINDLLVFHSIILF